MAKLDLELQGWTETRIASPLKGDNFSKSYIFTHLSVFLYSVKTIVGELPNWIELEMFQ